MNVATNKPSQELIQIPLYQEAVARPSFWKVISKISVAILIFNGLIYWTFTIKEPMIILTMLSLIIVILLTIYYLEYLLPFSSDTLVIAYGDLILIQGDKVLWSRTLLQLSTSQQYDETLKRPVLTIADEQEVLLTIVRSTPLALFRRKKTVFSFPYYNLYASADWKMLIEILKKQS